jgi:tetratricopeptide (TPR) repeat protein
LAQQAAGQLDEATATITTFLERLQEEIDAFEEEHEDDDEEDEQVSPPGEAAKIRAHTELARISLDRDDPEAAEAELRTLVELLPDQSAPYVELGRFLRLRKRLDEALEVLGKGQKFMGELRPDMSVPREIGLTQMELGNDAAAITSLKAVVDYSVAFGNFNFDPTVALPLATLYERNDQPDEAAHLFRHLAAGTYAAGHFTYNLEAGRLLIETKELDLARKYLSRAKELASGDDDTAKVEELMGKAG